MDAAVNPSRQAMAQGLLALMAREDFHRITVLQVCQEAGVSRRTFYRHFRTKEEVLAFLLEQMRQEFMAAFETGNAPLDEVIRRCFAYFDRHRALLSLLHRHRQFLLVKEVLERYMRSACAMEMAAVSGRAGMEDYYAGYYAGSLCAILEMWVRRDFDVPPGELAAFMVRQNL